MARGSRTATITSATFAGAILLFAGCADEGGGETAASTSAASPATAADDLGTTYAITRADNAEPIGRVRITEVAEIPAECIADDTDIPGSRPLGIRLEIENVATLAISTPDESLLQVNDAGGFTRKTASARLQSRCTGRYPELADAPTPGKAAGWVVVESPVPDPGAIVVTALVWSEDASIENWKIVEAEPSHVVVRIPDVPAAGPAPPAPSTTTIATPPLPAPTPAPAATTAAPLAPVAGQACDPDTDGWGTDASGGTLRCGYFGGPTPKWVNSAPLIGVRAIGTPCDQSVSAVAESPDGIPLVCTSTGPDFETSTWQPGP